MRHIVYILLSAILLSACTEQQVPEGYGFLQVSSLNIETQTDIQPLKRSVDNRLQVDICQGTTVIRTYTAGAPELNTPISLPVGNYTLHAHTADMNEAANNEPGNPVYSVSTDFVISEGTTTDIEPLSASQINTGIQLQYPEEIFNKAFTQITCTLTSPSGRSVTIKGTDYTGISYFKLPENGLLQYTIQVTNTDNEVYVLPPTPLPIEAGKNYCIEIRLDK